MSTQNIHASYQYTFTAVAQELEHKRKRTGQDSQNLFEKGKVLEVHEKNDLVPALVHKKKFDCVPRSNHETCMKCFNWKFTKNMIEFPFPLMKYELVRELSFIDCVLPIP